MLEEFDEKKAKRLVWIQKHFLEKQFKEVIFTVFCYCLAKDCLYFYLPLQASVQHANVRHDSLCGQTSNLLLCGPKLQGQSCLLSPAHKPTSLGHHFHLVMLFC